MKTMTRDEIRDHLRRELVKVLLKNERYRCPATHERINLKNAVVLVDGWGDPAMVCSQAAWARLNEDDVKYLRRVIGVTVDERTVKQ